jgi:hypothetical protein
VQRIAVALLAPFALTSCAFVLSQEHYRPVDRDRRPDGIVPFVPSVEVGLVWFVAGGHHGEYSVPFENGRLLVQGGPISWGQHWFGPLLPIFPVLMGAGSTTLEVDLVLQAEEHSLRIVPNEFLVRATRVQSGFTFPVDPLPPTLGLLNPDHENPVEPLRLTEPLELQPGDKLQLTFPFPVRTTERFEFLLPPFGDARARRSLPFRYEDNKFLVWGLLPIPFPSVRI